MHPLLLVRRDYLDFHSSLNRVTDDAFGRFGCQQVNTSLADCSVFKQLNGFLLWFLFVDLDMVKLREHSHDAFGRKLLVVLLVRILAQVCPLDLALLSWE